MTVLMHLLIINFLPSLPDLTHTKILLLYNNHNKTKYFPLQNPFLEDPALQIRDGHSQSQPIFGLWLPIFIIILIIVTGGFSKKSFIIFRSSCTQMFFKTGVVRNVAIFTGKHFFFWSLFLINFISTSS